MIETREIRVDYGEVTAVSDLTFSVGTGEIFGLIGPNGAGKTSLIKVLATLGEPTYGAASIAGFDVIQQRTQARHRIGYMPDLAPVFKDLRCWEFLDLFAASYSVPHSQRRSRISKALELVNLTAKRNAMAGTLSRGMTQRLVLAKTLLHDPDVLLLDEPASGLDPMARIDLRNLLKDLAERGKTVLISSHILDDLDKYCTSIGIMEKGRLVTAGKIDELVDQLNTQRAFTVETLGQGNEAADALLASDQVDVISESKDHCEFHTTLDEKGTADLLAVLVTSGVRVTAFYEQQRGIEELMIRSGAREVS
ncbi:MAG: ABC transporter ATP-binding protein [Phycisphaera sp.]|nr:MAG: ABC transporter ATP-binding protein [Phycisphaera sp.]